MDNFHKLDILRRTLKKGITHRARTPAALREESLHPDAA
jgi:hypothetical protein